jgi:hypothetical protein
MERAQGSAHPLEAVGTAEIPPSLPARRVQRRVDPAHPAHQRLDEARAVERHRIGETIHPDVRKPIGNVLDERGQVPIGGRLSKAAVQPERLRKAQEVQPRHLRHVHHLRPRDRVLVGAEAAFDVAGARHRQVHLGRDALGLDAPHPILDLVEQ